MHRKSLELKRASDIHPDFEAPVLGSLFGLGTSGKELLEPQNPAADLKRFAGRVTSSDASTCTETTDGIMAAP